MSTNDVQQPSSNSARQPGTGLSGPAILLLIMGIAAIVAAFTATVATVLIFGLLLLFAGIGQLLHALTRRTEDSLWRLLLGGCYALIGLVLTIDPVEGAIGLTLLLALLFLFSGLIRLVLAINLHRLGIGSGWHALIGVLNLVLAGLILSGWPQTGIWIIGAFIGIELILAGLTLMLMPQSLNRPPLP